MKQPIMQSAFPDVRDLIVAVAVAWLCASPVGCGHGAHNAGESSTEPSVVRKPSEFADIRLLDANDDWVAPMSSAEPSAKQPSPATVFLFVRVDCPISNRLAPEFNLLVKEFQPLGAVFYLVYPNANISAQSVRKHLEEYSYACGGLRDPGHELTRMTGATVTPEAAVLNSKLEVVYIGRINDLYVDFGKARAKPTSHDLRDALTDLFAGRPIMQPSARAVGCYISDLPKAAPGDRAR